MGYKTNVCLFCLIIILITIWILCKHNKKINKKFQYRNREPSHEIEGYNQNDSILHQKIQNTMKFYSNEDYKECKVHQHGFSHSLYVEPVNMQHWLPGYRRITNTFLVAPTMHRLQNHNLKELGIDLNLPNEFNEWVEKGWTLNIRDQKSCGGCFAFSCAEVLGIRYSIATGGAFTEDLSSQYIISCFKGLDGITGCTGGIPHLTFEHLTKYPIITEKDYPYIEATNYCNPESDGTCNCINLPSSACQYKVKNVVSLVQGNPDLINWENIPQSIIQQNVELMKKEIYLNGPISVGIQVYEDFYNFIPQKDNIYIANPATGSVGGHALTIVGWGLDAKTDIEFWIVQNSWGSNWGYTMSDVGGPPGGFYNHIMGRNSAFIESYASTVFPDLTVPCIFSALPKTINGKTMNWSSFDGIGTKTLRYILEKVGLTNSNVYQKI